ncbi:MAG: hypothetical protein AB2601_19950 [Candidatus Thiodiazotropha sp.]
MTNENFDERYWQNKAQWVIDTARILQSELSGVLGQTTLNFTKHYVAISSETNNNYFWLHRCNAGKVLMGFRVAAHLMDEVKALLDEHSITYVQKRKSLRITTNKEAILGNKALFSELAHMA